MERASTSFVAGRLALAVLLWTIHPALGFGQQVDLTPRIVNGVLTSEFPTTGALLNGTNAENAQTWCSGTLIGCSTFLTAGHCVADDLQPSHYFVFLQHAGIFSVASIDLNPNFNFPVGDVAVLKLGSPVTGIRPTRINNIQDPPFGTAGTIVGFGRSGGSNSDYGLKRYGAVETTSCSVVGVSNTTSVCWTFDAPAGSPGTNSNTCNADSGGPLFLTLGGESVVAGITSGGVLDSCLTGDGSYDADVYNYRSYIQSKAGVDIVSTTCGTIGQVGDSEVSTKGYYGSVSSGSPQAVQTFTVPPGAAELRVTMNAIDNGSDFDLYVRRGSAPSTSVYDCAQTGSNQYGVCSFANPASGTWYAMVARANGSGTYQLTVSSFGGGCEVPGNAGLACDDNNPCTINDLCGEGVCQGTLVADNTPCGEGTLCAPAPTCQAGTCTSDVLPATGCKQTVAPGRASVMIKDSTNSGGDKAQWKWMGEETQDFGDPTKSTDYAFCVYDQSRGVPNLVLDQTVPAGAFWQPMSSGFRYLDNSAANDGVRSIKLHKGGDGNASVVVLSRGPNLQFGRLPFHQDGEVLVQLVNSEKMCWEARYTNSMTNTSARFRAKSD